LVYLLTKNLNLFQGRARKLCPKFMGPYKVLTTNKGSSMYTLELPKALQEQRIFPSFHISLLRPYYALSDAMFPEQVQPNSYDFRALNNQEWFIDEIIGHPWKDPRKLEFQVQWSQGDTTWKPENHCSDLEALDCYLELRGIQRPTQLPKKT
jgi:hypothetical protein